MTPIMIDLEWNHPEKGRWTADGIKHEIIQIGAAKVDAALNVTERFDVMVKPKYYTKLTKSVKDLTQISDEELAQGISFTEAVDAFRAWCGEDYCFVQWGGCDLDVIEENCLKHGYDTDWLPATYDAQLIFDDYEMGEGRCFPLNYGLYHFNERPESMHNALSDAVCIAQIMRHLDFEQALTDDYFRCDRLETAALAQ